MIDYDGFCKIRQLYDRDALTASQIAKELNLDRRTVTRWLEVKRYEQRKAALQPSKLDPFKDTIVRMLESHDYSATQVFQHLQAQGFDGGYSIVKTYVRKIRPIRKPAYLRLSFAPGECAQVDWGSYGSVNVGNTRRRLSFFAMVLSYSRMLYVEFSVSQTMEHFLACHQNAFEFFGSVPSRIMVDNLKSAVLRRIVGQGPVFNPRYKDFADHTGFDISACNVRAGNEKGRVESAVGYVKKNFLRGLAIDQFSPLNPACRHWMDTIANVRTHGETRKRPVDLFKEERAHLQPLPVHPHDIGTVSQVRASSQFRITLDTNRYSVPAEYASSQLTLKLYPDRLCLYSEEKLIARHTRSFDRHQDIENPEHPKALLAQRKKAKDQQLFARFLRLSNKANAYYQGLSEKRLNPNQHVRKIVALSEIHGIDALARAMQDAIELQAYSSEYIANILEQRSRILPEPGALHLTRREDLLDLQIQQPDMDLYQNTLKEPLK